MRKKILIVSVIVVASAGMFMALNNTDREKEADAPQAAAAQINTSQRTRKLKEFSGEEFRRLFDNLSLPNTTPIVAPPAITGNADADKRIHALAEARGYKLRLVASSDLNVVADDIPLQELAARDWEKLVAAAQADGIQLEIVSGFRSLEEQYELFNTELRVRGLNVAKILSGAADASINDILQFASPPGYSRHHSGYTIDIKDASATVFKYSRGYEWISRNNFENAKQFGFIPSYPEEVESQGPEPEPWEYVWANKDFVSE